MNSDLKRLLIFILIILGIIGGIFLYQKNFCSKKLYELVDFEKKSDARYNGVKFVLIYKNVLTGSIYFEEVTPEVYYKYKNSIGTKFYIFTCE